MNINLIIIKLFLRKDYYTKYNNIINLEYYKNNNREMYKVFLSLIETHSSCEEDVTITSLMLSLSTLYPNLKDEELLTIERMLSSVEELEVDETKALEYLNAHYEKALATELAIKSLDVSQGRGTFDELRDIVNRSELNVEDSTNDYFVSTDLVTLMEDEELTHGLDWRLETLNRSLGPLRKGNFGFIFARPETGKTTFLASEGMFMAEQAKENGQGPVIWFNNEEGGSVVVKRCYQAYFGVTSNARDANMVGYAEAFKEKIGEHFLFYDHAGMGKKDIESVCAKLNPSLIIIDQIDKVRWPDSERYDLKMKSIYQWARELSKQYGPVIAVCQAGGTAEGKKYLNMNDVDSSHTAKQGEADFMLGIGKTNTEGEESLRFLSICKNKLEGGERTMQEMRHSKTQVRILPEIARYADIMEWN